MLTTLHARPFEMHKLVRPSLSLSLQFDRSELIREHRQHLSRSFVTRCIRAALEAPADITVRIVGAEEARALNRDYRSKDYATNVLTFDYSHAPQVHADLVLCADVVEAEAAAQNVSLSAHYAHLLMHGTLHAQGYDHEEEKPAQLMEARETKLLAALGFADPYAVN
jgi:probable rRNA maturation factor